MRMRVVASAPRRTWLPSNCWMEPWWQCNHDSTHCMGKQTHLKMTWVSVCFFFTLIWAPLWWSDANPTSSSLFQQRLLKYSGTIRKRGEISCTWEQGLYLKITSTTNKKVPKQHICCCCRRPSVEKEHLDVSWSWGREQMFSRKVQTNAPLHRRQGWRWSELGNPTSWRQVSPSHTVSRETFASSSSTEAVHQVLWVPGSFVVVQKLLLHQIFDCLVDGGYYLWAKTSLKRATMVGHL